MGTTMVDFDADAIMEILEAPEDKEGYGIDAPVKTRDVVDALLRAIESNKNDEIAEFLYNYGLAE